MDALPLFHTQFVAASLLQAAFTQADAHGKTVDCEVCGYYTANEREQDTELSSFAKAVARKVAANCEHAWCGTLSPLPLSRSAHPVKGLSLCCFIVQHLARGQQEAAWCQLAYALSEGLQLERRWVATEE